ncbi:MAG: hypothetical protein JXA37_03670, partial [Chloroflexia bacterium]|nr:hypothetical protein [Chloroflexia bacterium]
MEKVDWQSLQRQSSTPAPDLYAAHELAQSFVAHQDGLNGIELLLVDYGAESGRPAADLQLRLCRSRPCEAALAETTLPGEGIAHNQAFRFRFDRQEDSAGQTYFLVVNAAQADSPARATLWAHDVDLYPEGQLLYDAAPAPADLTFCIYYDVGPASLLGELLARAWGGLRYLPSLLLLLLAPGYLLLRLLPRHWVQDPFELLGFCLGLSLALVPVLLLLLAQTPIRLSAAAVCGGGILLGGGSLGLFLRDLARGHWNDLRRLPRPLLYGLLGVLALALFLRAVHSYDLAGPLWIDAVHHGLLSRLIVERGAIPADYHPYIDVAPATYHFGFQSLVSLLHWLTGLRLPGALLLLGQALSGLASLPLYAWGRRWGRSGWAGLAAAAVPAALSLMPSYYVSWSRYTQLAGLLILPVAVLLLEQLLQKEGPPGWAEAVVGLVLAGIVLTHVRVAAFLAVLAVLMLLAEPLRRRPHQEPKAILGSAEAGTSKDENGRALFTRQPTCPPRGHHKEARGPGRGGHRGPPRSDRGSHGGLPLRPAGRLALASLVGALLAWPWLWPSLRALWLPAARNWPAAVDQFSLYFVRFGPGRYLFPVALAGVTLALLWRRREALLLALWVGGLLLLANPHWLGLSLGSVVDNLAVTISLFVPLALGAALAVGGLAKLARAWAQLGETETDPCRESGP